MIAAAPTPRGATWLVPAGLFLLALAVRLVVIPIVAFAPNEGAAYYVGVAANLVSGHGLVSNAVWSYATSPQVVPKPAFELWMPLASLVAALPMTILGGTLAAAQLATAVLGAVVAPLAWVMGRDAAGAAGLDERRTRGVAITSGLLAAVLAPFVAATAGPDSTTPFLVLGTLAAVLMPRALPAGPGTGAGAGTAAGTVAGGTVRRSWPGFALGIALGLAYLSRQEAIWLALTFLLLLTIRLRGQRPRRVLREGVGALAPVVIGGLIMVLPWLARDLADLGSPFPGQAVENLWLRRNEDIFAWADRPSAAAYLARGAGALIGDRLGAIVHQLIAVLLLPAFPVGLLGLVAVVSLRRSPALRGSTALTASLMAGGATFLATALLFPVATQWGTYLHSAGPLLVGLIVATALAGDALLARVSARRGWAQVNVIITPIALLAVAVPLLVLQLLILARQADALQARLSAVAADLATRLPSDPAVRPTIITDHPMWLAAATGGRAIALPDEPLTDVADLARTFGTTWLVVLDDRGRYPAELLADPRPTCLAADPERIGPADDPAWLIRLAPDCSAP